MSEKPQKQLAINPAFFREIKEDREELFFIEQKIKYLLHHQEIFRTSQPEFRELTELFRDQLALHFSLEEAFGYFDEALEVAPHMHNQSLSLRSQHSELYLRSQQLVDAANRVPDMDLEVLASRTQSLMDAIDLHEAAETELIQRALNEDMGGDG